MYSKYSGLEVIKSVIKKCVKYAIISYIVGFIVGGIIGSQTNLFSSDDLFEWNKIVCFGFVVLAAIKGFIEQRKIQNSYNSYYYANIVCNKIQRFEEVVDIDVYNELCYEANEIEFQHKLEEYKLVEKEINAIVQKYE